MLGVSGRDMIEQFLFHMEQFPIAEHTGSALKKVSKEGERFIVAAEDGAQFTGHSLIYCAGKEYRRLGIPGEERFIGRGIAFCATCDAPLYQNKKVAVIGGGNSAFTSVRDLIGFAAEIYLIHRRDAFTADPVLVEEIKKARNVKFYTNSQTQEFLGKDRLEGIRLITAADGKPVDLQVDGVFLEIGLVPNSAPVKDLVKLNGRGEIPVSSDNSTNVPGLYAAGDVTDIPEKQIIIAAGEGAKAALSAHKYLLEKKLIKAIVLPEYGA
jgi:alkyl hydroperoxide reductase subunit F